MGDALIVRRGGSGSSSHGNLKTVLITSDQEWTVPKAKDQMFMVRIFGGGQAGDTMRETSVKSASYKRCASGGCGGMMNNAILILDEGNKIPITIGNGGERLNVADISRESRYNYIGNVNSGKTTFFGKYLSAYGGGQVGIGIGGSGGGSVESFGSVPYGIGTQFGGGGMICVDYRNSIDHGPNIKDYNNIKLPHGSGGKWGGGGGKVCNNTLSSSAEVSVPLGGLEFDESDIINDSSGSSFNVIGVNGYGGNGGKAHSTTSTAYTNGNAGTNTFGLEAIFDINAFTGYGRNGSTINYNNSYSAPNNSGSCRAYPGGGGGYGGNGGNACGGGGGYGGNGGNNIGGGGGYGADGGEGSFNMIGTNRGYYIRISGGGGGGGYGKSGKGGNAEKCAMEANTSSSGNYNEYLSKYTKVVSNAEDGGYAAGGGSFGWRNNTVGDMHSTSGGKGICIITYYAE